MSDSNGKRVRKTRSTPVLDRALAALAANPQRSNRSIAAAINVSDVTVARARARAQIPSASHYASKDADPQPGDEAIGAWPRERLIAMDSDFVERVERAFETGSERRESAGGARQRVG
jgi:hypothetical protein